MKHLNSVILPMQRILISTLFYVCTLPSYADYPVAGLNPSVRPAGAPVITKVEKDDAWYRYAVTGISKPYPISLKFLEDQGNWVTPFTRPGAPGRG